MLPQPEYSNDDGLHTIEGGGEKPTVEYDTSVPENGIKLNLIY